MDHTCIDALVHEKVFGESSKLRLAPEPWQPAGALTQWSGNDAEPAVLRLSPAATPSYSLDIAQAWRVAEAMKNKGYSVVVELFDSYSRCDMYASSSSTRNGFGHARADTPSLAICMAALKALRVDTAQRMTL